VLGVALLGCGDDMGRIADGGLACDTDGCDNPDPDMFACQNVLDAAGRPLDATVLDGLGDPFAQIVLKRPGECPRSLAEMVAKLRLEDSDRCEGDPRTGMLGRIVSERAQLLEKPDVVRAVVSRQCRRRLPYELLFTTPSIDADNPALPEPVQVMAFDRVSATYNFYALQGEGEGAEWVFHGNSFDQITPNAESACAACHTDGGLVMRELDAPWLHWESAEVRTVGAGGVVDRFSELGARSMGAELSEVVQAGNAQWSRTRIRTLADPARTDLHGGSTRALLEPLFCGSSLNLQSAGTFESRGVVQRVPSSFFVDPMLRPQGAVEIDEAAYIAALGEVGSHIEGLVGPRDTLFGFTFVERAAADVAYIEALIERGIVDEEFVLDVLSVDFTAPVYSLPRCALLDHAPTFDALGGTTPPPDDTVSTHSCCIAHEAEGCDDDGVMECVCEADAYCCDNAWDQACVNAAIEQECATCSPVVPERGLAGARSATATEPTAGRVRNAFYAALEGVQGEAAATLRSALAARDQSEAHRDRAERFVKACADRAAARDPEGFVRDMLEVAAWRRREARAASALLDTPGVVATDTLDPAIDLRFDPVDCTLQ